MDNEVALDEIVLQKGADQYAIVNWKKEFGGGGEF